MTSKRSLVLVIAVIGVIALGLAIMFAGYFANEKNVDRETLVAAAQYDGAKLLEELASVPDAKPLGYIEMKKGPLTKDLSTSNEAWVRWKQHWATGKNLTEVIAWHREKLNGSGWKEKEGPTRSSARFFREQWEIVLEPDENREKPLEKGFVRRIEWNRSFPSHP